MQDIERIQQSDFKSVSDTIKFNEWKESYILSSKAVRSCGFVTIPGFIIFLLSWVIQKPILHDFGYAIMILGAALTMIVAQPKLSKARRMQKELSISDAEIREAVKKLKTRSHN
jgi:hypothetical protein